MFLAITLRLFFLGVFLASIWYVASRLRILFDLKRRWALRLGVAAGFFGSIFAMLATARAASVWIGSLNVIGGYVFTIFIYLVLLLLVLHLVQLKWKRIEKWSGPAALVIALALTVSGALRANSFTVVENEIKLAGLKKDVLVMHISDVHIGHHRGRAYLEEIVTETNGRNPDVVLINGDLVDANAALLPGVLSPLEKFEAPVFFVGGNHDNYVDTKRAFELIARHGVRILHNEIINIHGIQLVGLDYMNPDEDTFDMHPSHDKRTIKEVLPTLVIDEETPTVLVHHSPVGLDYVTARGIDLMVSGHTHAGQMFPANLLTPFIFPLNKGLYERNGTTFFVSQGAGTYGPRIRLGTSNEINLIRLKAKQ